MASDASMSIVFRPPDADWQQAKADMISIRVMKNHDWSTAISYRNEYSTLCTPKTIKTIGGEGDCFFKAMSWWIAGSEQYHTEVRAAVISEMIKNDPIYRSEMTGSAHEYIRLSRMNKQGVYATDVEVRVTATLLQTSIVVYSEYKKKGFWQVIHPLRNTERTPFMIYLQNKNAHFEAVIDM